MQIKRTWTVSMFEDEDTHARAMWKGIVQLFTKKDEIVSVRLSRWADRPPSELLMTQVGTPEATAVATESNRSLAAFDDATWTDRGGEPQISEGPQDGEVALARLCRQDLDDAHVIIVDLKMPPLDTPKKTEYGGLEVLRLARKARCLGKCFVCSQEIASIAGLPEIRDELSGMIAEGLTVFRKLDDSDSNSTVQAYGDLCAKVYSFIDLDRAQYSLDARTRNTLFMIARRGSEADSMEPVLVLGNTGTGKETAARHIHNVGQWLRRRQSERSQMVEMTTIHCGALSPELARDDLFGHVRGAFTGAENHELGPVLSAVGCKLREPPVNKTVEIVESFQANLDRFEAASRAALEKEDLVPAAREVKNVVNVLKSILDFSKTEAETSFQGKSRKRQRSEEYREWLLQGSKYLGESIFEDVESDEESATGTGAGSIGRRESINLRIKTNAPYGTVFLDEFGDLHPRVQALLIRFLQTGEVRPLGFGGSISLMDKDNRLHVRFIGATNNESVRSMLDILRKPHAEKSSPKRGTTRDVAKQEEVENKDSSVREDLVYRLAHWVVELPDLQPDEISNPDGSEPGPLLKIEQLGKDYAGVVWEPEALKWLRELARDRRFPGHRRQLRTVVMRAAAYATGLSAAGLEPFSGGLRNTISKHDLQRALQPITPKTGTLQSSGDLVRDFFIEKKLWPDCAGLDWSKAVRFVRGSADRDVTLCALVLHSVKLLPHIDSCGDLEALWNAGKGAMKFNTNRAKNAEALKKAYTIVTETCDDAVLKKDDLTLEPVIVAIRKL